MQSLVVVSLFFAAFTGCVLSLPLLDPTCPDSKVTCKSTDTCCELDDGQQACCPLQDAVCCEDKKHCCPKGYQCDTEKQTCKRGNSFVPFELSQPPPEIVNNVICPGSESECPNKNTCCDTGSGKYSCCPEPDAVCCSDHKHCCPAGYTCEVSEGKCAKAGSKTALISIFEKPLSSQSNVICPDKEEACPSGNTCCESTTGKYGCCPETNAVCCSDHVHCCPQGYSCDIAKGKCEKSSSKTLSPFLLLSTTALISIFEKPLSSQSNVICPDKEEACPSGNTCCKSTTGKYGCCPETNAVCCSDRIHCCPQGYSCDLAQGKCEKSSSNMLPPFLLLSTSSMNAPSDVTNVICPNHKEECPEKNTCCQLESGNYGCCPVQNAVCCSDGKHCCPNDYACDPKNGQCTDKKSTTLLITLNNFQDASLDPVQNVKCPGNDGMECADQQTCCKLTDGNYGCCPQSNAVCCSDGKHCCPHGYTCGKEMCVKSGTPILGHVPLSTGNKAIHRLLTPPADISSPQKTCPDSSTCNSNSSCCPSTNGAFWCCPLTNSICCSTNASCCPKDTVCCLYENHCCPSDYSVCCTDGHCCNTDYPVCCSNGKNCCPAGTYCDKDGRCISNVEDESVTFLIIEAPKVNSDFVGNVVCPDDGECPSGDTCCPNTSGGYGCCPESNGVCCPDNIHCCPSGYTCKDSIGKCVKGKVTVPFLMTKLSTRTSHQPETIPLTTKADSDIVGNVVCPDQGECPSGDTCCPNKSGGYGCCPESNGVCCPDNIHCCPGGYTCEDSIGKCVKGEVSVPFLTTKLSTRTSHQPETIPLTVSIPKADSDIVGNVVCPDDGECPSGDTCCPNTSGGYGCCPESSGVCCPDKIHCCPSGYTCIDPIKECVLGEVTVPFLTTKLSTRTPNKPETIPLSVPSPKVDVRNVVCPDGKGECPSDNTCCSDKNGGYSCCPENNAVCCPDEIHCCPSGYTCEDSIGKCEKNRVTVPFLTTVLSRNIQRQPEILSHVETSPIKSPVLCPDKQSECPEKNTCCKVGNGKYGCCPEENAVCCSDKKHCCPSGSMCDTESQKCMKKNELSTSFLEMVMVQTNNPEHVNIVCPDGKSQCPGESTCCLSPTGYGCCSHVDAVCCPDMKHCCPKGYRCHDTSGECVKENGETVLFSLLKSFQEDLKPGNNVICPDDRRECPEEATCCPLSNGGFGCCPVPKAVCCMDGKHCCPEGYTCDTAGGVCVKGSVSLPFLEAKSKPKKTVLSHKNLPQTVSVVCPDETSECPPNNTCCRLKAGNFGCCPLTSAMCCEDGEHCCPNGYICEAGTEKCVKNTAETSHSEDSLTVPEVIKCHDGSECPDGKTCCMTKSAGYGCCNGLHAVCCSDHEHCCPQGYRCDLVNKHCVKGDTAIPFPEMISANNGPKSEVPFVSVLDNVKSHLNAPNNIYCPGYEYECSDGQTCCYKGFGYEYGCCPYPYAVCCSDHKTCCPSGTSCGLKAFECDSLPLLQQLGLKQFKKRIPLVMKKLPSSSPPNVVCPNKKTECEAGNTCCKKTNGEYGCCPVDDAVCCEDMKHCCPHGYECNLKDGKCVLKSTSNSLLEKLALMEPSVICPDQQSECPSGNTCCRNSLGQMSCCPIADAKCCSDHKHCCPSDYTCDDSKGVCLKQVEMLTFTDNPSPLTEDENSVICPNHQSECPAGNTCCKLSNGEYGCCPVPHAVCCSDKYCCPQNTRCDLTEKKCIDENNKMPLLVKKPSVSRPESITCPDGKTKCPNQNTCCILQTGTYGCCNSPQAVCCPDNIQCCPHGYKCQPGSQYCVKDREAIIALFTTTTPPTSKRMNFIGRFNDNQLL